MPDLVSHTVTVEKYPGFEPSDAPLYAARCTCGMESFGTESDRRVEVDLERMHDSGWSPRAFSEQGWPF